MRLESRRKLSKLAHVERPGVQQQHLGQRCCQTRHRLAKEVEEERQDVLAAVAQRWQPQHGLEKIKTIGDAYMAAAGIPVPCAAHAERVADMPLEMQELMRTTYATRYPALQLRIGIHCSPAVAGVIGKRKFTYDLWGDSVNTASRMESHGLPGRVHVSAAVKQRLAGQFAFESRGRIEVKAKGAMET